MRLILWLLSAAFPFVLSMHFPGDLCPINDPKYAPLKKHGVDATWYKKPSFSRQTEVTRFDETQYIVACTDDEIYCCYNLKTICSVFEFRNQDLIPLGQKAKTTDGFCREDEADHCEEGLRCSHFVCCLKLFVPYPPYNHHLSCPPPSQYPNFLPDRFCTQDSECMDDSIGGFHKSKFQGYCMAIIPEKILRNFPDHQKIKGCCYISHEKAPCSFYEQPILLNGETFEITTEHHKKECLKDKHNRIGQYDSQRSYCCPKLVSRDLMNRDPPRPTEVDSYRINCEDHTQCPDGQFCDGVLRADGQESLPYYNNEEERGMCIAPPRCTSGHTAEVDSDNDPIACDYTVQHQCYKGTSKPGYCEKDYFCCPSYCPYYLKSRFAKDYYLPRPDWSCPQGLKDDDSGNKQQLTQMPDGLFCCWVDQEFMCPHRQFPALDNYLKPKPNKCPAGAYWREKRCCYHFVSTDLGSEVLTTSNDKTCSHHNECKKDEFCGKSTFAVEQNTFVGDLYHCYPKPAFEGGIPLLIETRGIRTCASANDCHGTDVLSCETPTVKVGQKTVKSISKICFSKACPFGEKPHNPTKTCREDSECADGGCFRILGSSKHCCPVSSSFPLCPPKEFPIAAKDGSPNGDCDTKISYRKLLDGKNYCCPKLHHGHLDPVNIEDICTGKSCGPEHVCVVSRRVDKKPTRNRYEHCYKHPKCNNKGSNSVSLRKGEMMECAKDEDCMIRGEQPRYCASNKLCCDLGCPYWPEVFDKHTTKCPNGQCSHPTIKNELCTDLGDAGRRCCLVANRFRCPGGQLPVMMNGMKIPRKKNDCPKGSFFREWDFYSQKPNHCCRNYQLKGSLGFAPRIAECASHQKCNPGEFCGESEFTEQQKGLEGQPKFCYTVPLFDGVPALTEKDVGLRKCSSVKDCKNIPDIAVCVDIAVSGKNIYGSKLCVKKSCPFGLPSKDPFNSCKDQLNCAANTVCTTIGTTSHCCPVEASFMCPSGQFPIQKEEKKCPDGTLKHPSKDLCCAKFVSKFFKDPIFTVDHKRNCKENSECGSENFCGESTILYKSNMLQGKPKHCYPRPAHDNIFAVASARETELIKCDQASQCKTKNPTVCEKIQGVKLCFERSCPFGKLSNDPFKICKDSSECGGKGTCMKVLGNTMHCCPMEGVQKCPNGEMPVLAKDSTINGECDTATSEITKIGSSNFCCPKFAQKFTKTPPTKASCGSTKKDCESGHVCEEGVRLDGMARASQTKQCYARPKCKSGQHSLIRDDEFLAVCKNDADCIISGDAPGYCENGFCCPTLCPHWKSVTSISFSPKFCKGTDPTECGPDSQCTDLPSFGKTCCFVNTWRMCHTEDHKQLPVLNNLKMARNEQECPKHAYFYKLPTNEQDFICCYKMISKDLSNSKITVHPSEISKGMPKECAVHSDCEKNEFCGASELEFAKETLRGAPRHCFKKPEYERAEPVLLDGFGIKTCDKDAECATTSNNPAVCKEVNKMNKVCFEKSCPFGKSSTTLTTCQSNQNCPGEVCVNVIGTLSHCCPVMDDFRCHKTQLPVVKNHGGMCEKGSDEHRVHKDLCCNNIVNKQWKGLTILDKDEECDNHEGCPHDYFCGESTLEINAAILQGTPKHCYKRPSVKVDVSNLFALRGVDGTNLQTCKDSSDCKSTNPVICETTTLAGEKMCFDKICPYGEGTTKSPKTCSDHSGCPGELCVPVFPGVKHCCPVSGKLKCHVTQLPYMTDGWKQGEVCKNGSLANTETRLCCQKFIYKPFGETQPLFVSGEPRECSIHSECHNADEFCGESTLMKMASQLIGAPKHCYKKPLFKSAYALTTKDHGLALCQTVTDCPATEAAVCEEMHGTKICFQKPCIYGVATIEPPKTCSSHDECQNSLCVSVFDHVKHCCPPSETLRCYGIQLPFIKSEDTNKCSTDHINGMCCQDFIYKDFGSEHPLVTTSKNRECRNHEDCQKERGRTVVKKEFCGTSTLLHMEKRVQGTPRHCYPIPTYKALNPLMNQGYDLAMCNDLSDCASVARDAAVCMEADVGTTSKKKICFEDKCPFKQASSVPTTPCNIHDDCPASLCVTVHPSTNLKHCCPVADELKCHGTQLFYLKEGTKTCEDGSVKHPSLADKCCQRFIYKGFGESDALYSVDDMKECHTHVDCDEGQFCGLSTLFKMGHLLLGNPKHCYIRPEFEGQKVMLAEGHGLRNCTDVTGCKTTNPAVCETGISNGAPVKATKMCFEKVCPFGIISKNTEVCDDHAGCKDSVCVGQFSTQKFCCPVGNDFFCHRTQFPFIKHGANSCEDGSEKHPKRPNLCCQKFTYKLFSPDTILHPIVENNVYKECAKGSECGASGFCGESILLHMQTIGSPKHCYPRPILDTHPAILSKEGELILCQDLSICPGDKISVCEEPMFSSGALKNKKVCYEGPCPLWHKPIDRKDVKTCSADSECLDGKDVQCVNVFKKEKHCCKISQEKLCPGENTPVLDAQHKVLKNCDKDLHFEYKVGGDTFCCVKPISNMFYAAGLTVEASDNTILCTKNAECNHGTFCGGSVTKDDKKAFEKPLKHCYKEPSGAGGIPREYEESEITVCEKHEDCNIAKGEYCNTELGSEFSKGICHVARCPLTNTFGPYKQCSSTSECNPEFCHPISEKNSGCCSIDSGNLCPGGLIPSLVRIKECTNNGHFLHRINDVDVCCRNLVSEIMKKAGSDWPITRSENELANSMETKKCTRDNGNVCTEGTYCDVSLAMDGTHMEIEIMHCYPVPKSHGVTVVGPPQTLKTCSMSSQCDQGQICDTKLNELDATIDPKTGVCSIFKCPLAAAANVAKALDPNRRGSDLCSEHLDCGGDTECHPVGVDRKFKGCCGSDDEFRCPGGIIPRKYNKKLGLNQDTIKCEVGKEVKYQFGDGNTPSDEARCCPTVVSRDFYLGRYEGNQGDMVEPLDSTKVCTKHEECQNSWPESFCGESMLMENFKNGKELNVKGDPVHHCYPRPRCSGTTILGERFGLSICTQNKNTCGNNEICDHTLGSLNDEKYRNTGVCCSFTCKGSAPESKMGGSWKAGKTCDDCAGRTEQQEYCDKSIENDDTKLEICEKTSHGTYRLCKYERDPVTCSLGLDSVLRKSKSHELISCTIDFDCRAPGRNVMSDARPRCVKPSRPIPEFSKVCCTADLCSDMFTERRAQPVCQVENDECKGDHPKLKGKCEKRYEQSNSSSSLHCCPSGSVDDGVTFTVDHPFRLAMDCTSLSDCIGEKRFCDPFTKKCMYYGSTLNSRDGSCTEKDTHCGTDMRDVCMKVHIVTDEGQPNCYAHPFDECSTNTFCGQSAYCAPEAGTPDEQWTTAFRKCHQMPDRAVREEYEIGLKACKENEECDSRSCDKSIPNLAIQPGHGFCKHAIDVKCRGISKPKYENGESVFCSMNSECLEDEFCDVEIDRHSRIPRGKGVCCTVPKCGGTAVKKNETGLKICSKDVDPCDLASGEICHLDISKLANKNTWKDGEGVCCRMDCPTSENKEATLALPAGPICSAETECKSNATFISQCVDAPNNVSYTRCCSYERNPSVCPAVSKGVVREGLDAKECKKKNDCPDNASCENGWCCIENFCSDKMTVRHHQPMCKEKTKDKDCKQPSGAEALCEEGHCCPKTDRTGVTKPFMTEKSCEKVNDCVKPMMFCHPKHDKCTYFGSDKTLQTNKPCAKNNNKTCDGDGVCVFRDENRNALPLCWKNPMGSKQSTRTAQPQTGGSGSSAEEDGQSNVGMILGVVAILLVLIAAAAIGIFIYYKYRASKAGKGKKEKKDDKKGDKKGKKEKATKKKGKGSKGKKQGNDSETSSVVSGMSQSMSIISVKDSQISGADSEVVDSRLMSEKPGNPNAAPLKNQIVHV